ncbi:uncharacterized [Tachysurus ichikawai]
MSGSTALQNDAELSASCHYAREPERARATARNCCELTCKRHPLEKVCSLISDLSRPRAAAESVYNPCNQSETAV